LDVGSGPRVIGLGVPLYRKASAAKCLAHSCELAKSCGCCELLGQYGE